MGHGNSLFEGLGAAARRVFGLVIGLAGLLAAAAPASAIPSPTTLSYTGGEQSYTIPGSVLAVGVAVQGAWGGEDNGVGQQGEGVTGYLTVNPGQSLFAEVGQNGSYNGGATFGGGGASGKPPPTVSGGLGEYANSGGGASDVRGCSLHAASCFGGGTSLGSRLIVAAGGGGFGGGGNGNSPTCSGPVMPGTADNHQTNLPNAQVGGPAPVLTSAGIVIPGFASNNHSSVMTTNGTTDAAFGSSTAGAGGVLAGCSSGGGSPTITYSDSVAGSPGSGPNGGTGGDASGLPPFSGSCTGVQCADAGPGGGGGGGYFGAGGGATGYDTCNSSPGGPCNDAGSGQGGAGGSSFAANAVQFPRAPGVLGSVRDQFIRFVPVIEVDAPAKGAVYSPGQSVNASWTCGFDATTGLGPGNNCAGTVASGTAISTTPGTHTFTVSGKVNNNASQVLSASVTYYAANRPSVKIASPTSGASYTKGQVVHSSFTCTEGSGGPGIKRCVDQGGHGSGAAIDTATTGSHTITVTATSTDGLTATKSVSYTVKAGSAPPHKTTRSAAGLKFTLSAPGSAVNPGGKLTVNLSKSGASKSYKVVRYTFYFDLGGAAADHSTLSVGQPVFAGALAHSKRKPVLVTSKVGAIRLALGHLSAGKHTLTLVIKLRSKAKPKPGHKPKTKTVTLRLPFTVA